MRRLTPEGEIIVFKTFQKQFQKQFQKLCFFH